MKIRKKSIVAFSLVEVTMALSVVVLSLVTIFGLLAIGIGSSHTSIEQTQATNLLTAVAADVQATTNSTPGTPATINSLVYGIPIPQMGNLGSSPPPAIKPPIYLASDGSTNSTSANSRYVLTTWITPGSTNSLNMQPITYARLMISWPAQVDYTKGQGSVETIVALRRPQ